MSDGGYPQRPSHFAHKAVRLAMKACMAMSEGPVAFAIFTCIAHTEDAKHYRGPVTWFDAGLLPIVGAKSIRAMALAREKLVEAGWLHYVPGHKGRPGTYWVLVPDFMQGESDSPSDENPESEFSVTKTVPQPPNAANDLGRRDAETRDENVNQTQRKRDPNVNQTQTKRELFNPVPIPDPVPDPKREGDAVASVSLKGTKGFVPPTAEQVAEFCEQYSLSAVDQVAWQAHYESNGWKIGRTSMKSWQACLRAWERRAQSERTPVSSRRSGGFTGAFLQDFAAEEVAT